MWLGSTRLVDAVAEVKAEGRSGDEQGVERRGGRRRSWVWVVVALLVLGAGFAAQRVVMDRAFDRLEADQVSQDARLVRIGTDTELRLLTSFGATNSYWDDSYQNVRDGDEAGLAVSFPPADLRSVYGVDGVLATGLDGTPRGGGLAGKGTFGQPPPELRDPAVLRGLFDPAGESGTARCGAVVTSTVPFLYCGFGAFSGSGAGPAGGLIFLRSLDPATLSAIGDSIGLPVQLVGATPAADDGRRSWPALTGMLGQLAVSTTTIDDDHIALAVTVPAGSGSFTLEAVRDRPIHSTALSVGRQLFALLVLLGAIVLAGLVVALRQGIRRQVAPLRRTAELVISSGDRTLRVDGDASAKDGEIGALGRAIDTMLDALAEQETQLAREQAGREAELARSFEEQRRAEEEAQRQVRALIEATAATVGEQLAEVTREVEQVRAGAGTIHQRVEATDDAARAVVEQVEQVDAVAAQLGESLRRVSGIAGLIRTVTDQTKLLALNATIEAERAGAAGRGFSVVASEVKELAASTAHSTDEITQTVDVLAQEAAELTRAIAGVVGEMQRIGGASADLRQVAETQRETLQRLDERVAEAVSRVEGIAH